MIYLYVSTFGNDISWIKFPNKFPIEVGSACRDLNHLARYPIKDDVGDNISLKNPYYGELTGLYYIWKNKKFKPTDIIGFTHYNKVLNITSKKVKKIFRNNYSWIVNEPSSIKEHSYPNDIKILITVLKNNFPKYYIAWKSLYMDNGASINNNDNCETSQMFFTSALEFDKYCTFLFGVLQQVNKKIGSVNRSNYHKRYCAFLGERLLSVYLKANMAEVYHVLAINKGGTRFGAYLRMKYKKSRIHFSSNSKMLEKLKKYLVGDRRSSYK